MISRTTRGKWNPAPSHVPPARPQVCYGRPAARSRATSRAGDERYLRLCCSQLSLRNRWPSLRLLSPAELFTPTRTWRPFPRETGADLWPFSYLAP